MARVYILSRACRLTFFNTVLLGTLTILLGLGDSFNTLIVVMLGRCALLGVLALCKAVSVLLSKHIPVTNLRRKSFSLLGQADMSCWGLFIG